MSKKIFLSVILFISLLFQNSILVSAYIEKGRPSNPAELETWKQWDFPGLSYQSMVPGGSTIQWSSCGYWAVLFARTKDDPKTAPTPKEFFADVYRKQVIDKPWGHLNFNQISKLIPTLHLATREEMKPFDLHISDGYLYNFDSGITKSERLGRLKELIRRGYYVICCYSTDTDLAHYILLDYVDEKTGDIRIYDSGYEGTWLSSGYEQKNRVLKYFIVLKGNDLSEKPSLYKDENAANTTNKLKSVNY